jgi:hypothetical protein
MSACYGREKCWLTVESIEPVIGFILPNQIRMASGAGDKIYNKVSIGRASQWMGIK